MKSNSSPPPDAPPLGQDLRDIPKEHIPTVLNSIVCEALLDFKRQLVGGEWQWSGTGVDGEQQHELFDLVHDDGLAIEMLTRFCAGQPTPLGYQLNYIPKIEGVSQQAMFQVYILQPDLEGNPQVLHRVDANRIGLGIALVFCGIVRADVTMQHRTLFPASYLSIAN